MKILMINPPFKYDDNAWITIPPQGYGGIQWIIKNLIDGLTQLGVDVELIGAPGSKATSNHLKVIDIAEIKDINTYLADLKGNLLVHDHSCRGVEFSDDIDFSNCKYIIHSHYLTSIPKYTNNLVAASYAHAKAIGHQNVPVVRHPVNPDNYIYSEHKEEYLLFMGRVSPWKGVHLAAEFAKKAGMKLKIVGPVWEEDYFNYIKNEYSEIIDYYGEAGGNEKKEILAKAKATLVFSGGIHTTTLLKWIEPGAQIVSESGISGTPVISSDNGCLNEIVPCIGRIIEDVSKLSHRNAEKVVSDLPSSQQVYDVSYREWNHIKIAEEYLNLYKKVWKNEVW